MNICQFCGWEITNPDWYNKYNGAIACDNCLIIFNRETGQKMATLPLTIPIGSTVEAYEKAGHKVGWAWEEGENA